MKVDTALNVILALISAPVVGNFTDESALMGLGDGAAGGGGEGANIGSGMPSDNTSLEYPLQRDEVQTTQQKNNHVPKSESDKHGLLPLLPTLLCVLRLVLSFV